MTDIFVYEKRRKKIGQRIRTLRKESGLTQGQLAARLAFIVPSDGDKAIGQSTISSWEKGVQLPPLQKIIALSSIFQCDIAFLLCDYDIKKKDFADIHETIGLSEVAIQKLYNLRCGNQVDWLTDILNAIVEQEEFVVLLFYALNYTVSGNREVEVTGDRHRLKVCCKDIYRMKLSDTLEQLLSTIVARFEGREDYRHIYSLYRSMYKRPDKNGIVHSLDEIRTDMEANGLTFDPMLFEGGENNG